MLKIYNNYHTVGQKEDLFKTCNFTFIFSNFVEFYAKIYAA